MNRNRILYKQGLILLIISLFTAGIKAQSPVVIVPQQDLTGTSNTMFQGRDGVKILAGTKFTPDATHFFKAWLDLSIVVPLQNGWTNETAIAERSLDPNLVVGTTTGSIDVSSFGSAVYSIPLVLPPGTAGMTPKIGIAYNSAAGNGVMGKGWDITGLSSISLSPKNMYNDGVISGLKFDGTDPYSLDGNRLIYDNTISAYRTEIESFSKITITSTDANGPLSFRVETKDGMIMEYGSTTDSRYRHSSNQKIISWYLSKVSDQSGNCYTYTYTNNATTGEFRLLKIDYTFNSGFSANSINFIYEVKPDNQITNTYYYGSLVADNVILKEIRIYAENQTSHTYKFNYSNDGAYQHLNEIQEYGADNSRYNSTVINWLNTKTTDYSATANNTYTDDYYSNQIGTVVGDFDGNGTDRSACLSATDDGSPSHNFLIKLNGLLISTTDPTYDVRSYQLVSPNNYKFKSVYSGCDFNGDGKEDALVKNHSNDTIEFIPLISNGTSEYGSFSKDDNNIKTFQSAYAKEVLGDFNRDGLTDLLIVNYGIKKFFLYQSTSNGPLSQLVDWGDFDFTNLFGMPIPYDDINLSVFPLDYNGDGLLDIIIQNRLYVNNGSGFNQPITILDNTNNPWGFKEFQCVDINGDGLSDIYGVLGDNSKHFYTSTGKDGGFVSSDASFLPDGKKLFADFNGDGKTDCFFGGPTSGLAYFIFNTDFKRGLSFVSNQFSNFTYPTNSNNQQKLIDFIFLEDFDGNGIPEPFFRYKMGFNPSFDSTDRYGNTQFSNVVVGISNGLGANIGLTYTSGSFPSLPCTYPITTRKISCLVVHSIATSNGLADNRNTTFYSYSNPKFYMQGKGFLGYMNVSKSSVFNNDIDEGTTSIDENTSYNFKFDNGPYYYYPINKTINYTITSQNSATVNKQVESSTYTTDYYDFGNNRFFPYVTTSDSYSYLWNADYTSNTPIHTTTQYTYSSTDIVNGNISSVTNTNGNNISTVTFLNYETKGSWCPNKFTTKTTLLQNGTTDLTSTETYTYNTKGLLMSKVAPPGIGDPNATGITQSVTTTYGYNLTYGMPTSVTVSGSDITSNSTSVMEYDPKYRFVVKSTNSLNHVTEATYEPKYGNVISSKDPNGLITTYKYDGFGRNTETTLPDGNTVKQEFHFGKPTDCTTLRDLVYHIKTIAPGSQPTYECFDKLGRSIRSMSRPSNEVKVFTTTFYNSFGKPAQTRQNSPNGIRLVTNYTYDQFFRDAKVELFTENNQYDPNRQENNYMTPLNNSITYTYSGLSVSINDNGKITDKAMTTTGLLGRVVDNLGSAIHYYYNAANQVTSITSVGSTTNITYDKYGRQRTLEEPNSGITTYTYNAFGQLKTQVDAKGTQYLMSYDALGRLAVKHEIPSGSTTDNLTSYTYDIEKVGTLAHVSVGTLSTDYKYDALSRNYKVIETIDGKTFTTTNTFDALGRVSRVKYPSNSNPDGNFLVNYLYDAYGKLIKITDANHATIWELQNINSVGVPSSVKLGALDEIKKTYSYTDYNTLSESSIKYTHTGIGNNYPFENKWNYTIDPVTSNLSSRTNTLTINGAIQRNLTENFEYDNLDRLLNVYKGPAIPANLTQALTYMANGNIDTKTETGTLQNFISNATQPHATSSIDPMANPLTVQAITYSPFNKMSTIDVISGSSSSKYKQTLTYGTDQERRKTIDQYSADGGTTYTDLRTKYYAQNYELITQGTTTKELHYISAPDGLAAIYELKDGVGTMYYAQTDYQGSLMMLVKADGHRTNDLSYDAWGNRRDPNTWALKTATDFETELNTPTLITDRGYTMHEHMDVYGLINMNGRAYDQRLGQFLSPDIMVQAPENTQSYNRYAYCLNNPMKYTDPSGFTSYYVDGVQVAPTVYEMMHRGLRLKSESYGNKSFNDDNNWQITSSERTVKKDPVWEYLEFLESRIIIEGEEAGAIEPNSISNSRTGVFLATIGREVFSASEDELEDFGNKNYWGRTVLGGSKLVKTYPGSSFTFVVGGSSTCMPRKEKGFWQIMTEGGDFGHDGANRGRITKQDVAVGSAVIATVATLGTYGELAVLGAKFGSYVIPTLSLANSIDDIGTNRNLESLSQQCTNNSTAKNILTATKIGIGALSFGTAVKSFNSMVRDQKFYGLMSGGIDGVATSFSIYNISHH